MLLPLCVGVCIWSLFCNIHINVFLPFLVFNLSKDSWLLNLNSIISFICMCFVCVLLCLPQGVIGWYVICDCGII